MADHGNRILPAIQSLTQQLRKDYLYCQYYGVRPMYTELEQVNETYQFNFPEGIYFAFYIWGISRADRQKAEPSAMEAAEALVRERLSGVDGDFETLLVRNRLFCLCGFRTMGQESMTRQLQALLADLNAAPGLRSCVWTLGLGQYVQNFPDILQSITIAQHALKKIVVHGAGALYDGNEPGTIYYGGMTMLNHEEQLVLERIIQNLQTEKLNRTISEFYKIRKVQIQKYPTYAYMLALQVLNVSIQTLRELMPIDRATYELSAALETQVDDQPSLSDLTAHTIRAVNTLCGRYQLFLRNGTTSPIWLVYTYIKEHYTEKLSLEALGCYADRNPQYLSALFSRELGMSITAYITSLRIEKAKSLLRSTDETIAQIGVMVGYQDSKYFSRVFHKQTGQYPLAYRQQSEELTVSGLRPS